MQTEHDGALRSGRVHIEDLEENPKQGRETKTNGPAFRSHRQDSGVKKKATLRFLVVKRTHIVGAGDGNAALLVEVGGPVQRRVLVERVSAAEAPGQGTGGNEMEIRPFGRCGRSLGEGRAGGLLRGRAGRDGGGGEGGRVLPGGLPLPFLLQRRERRGLHGRRAAAALSN